MYLVKYVNRLIGFKYRKDVVYLLIILKVWKIQTRVGVLGLPRCDSSGCHTHNLTLNSISPWGWG